MVHRREKLTVKEVMAQHEFFKKLAVNSYTSDKPIIVAMLGLVGSGKSSVARVVADHIKATVVNGDDIRVQLRKQGGRYEYTRLIAENAAMMIAKKGGSVVLDSDFIDPYKRASIRRKAKEAGVRLVFIRTYCDLDIMMGRIMTTDYSSDEFFGKAGTAWTGPPNQRGTVVKLREMIRRLPLHYRHIKKDGGQWALIRELPFVVLAEIDTADEKKWPAKVKECVASLGA